MPNGGLVGVGPTNQQDGLFPPVFFLTLLLHAKGERRGKRKKREQANDMSQTADGDESWSRSFEPSEEEPGNGRTTAS